MEGENKTVPEELLSTYRMIECAFPDGIEDNSYFPLLAILSERMSHRGVAQVMGLHMRKAYTLVLNDVYRAASTDVPDAASLAAVKRKLLHCGYRKWLNEDW